jgi:hypothetical protein
MSFLGKRKIGTVKKVTMLAALFFASFHLFFLLPTPQVQASENATIHHDLPADRSEGHQHRVCPTEIHQFTLTQVEQQVIQCPVVIASVDRVSQEASHVIMLAPIRTFVFAPPPKAQKTILLI